MIKSMEAKLIKSDVQYRLHNEEGIVIATSTDGKLSIKNCQAIDSGYDLDDLVLDYEKENEEHIQVDERQRQSYKAGFQKALEILGDKKYSEKDVKKAILLSMKYNDNAVIQSLQQTEWDVEIVMEYVGKIKLNKLHEMKPKLDVDGCLILKRK